MLGIVPPGSERKTRAPGERLRPHLCGDSDERLSAVCGTPGYFLFVLTFIAGWIVINLIGGAEGWRHHRVRDPSAYHGELAAGGFSRAGRYQD